jgi:hypothetical protein
MLLNVFFVDAQKTVDGYYVTRTNDTVFCSMLKFKGFREETNTYREIQIINGSGGSRSIYPKDIVAYRKDDVIYRSFNLVGKNVFVKSLVQGSASLYYYSDEEENGYYIFKRNDETDFSLMDYTFHFAKILGPNPGMNQSSTGSGLTIRHKDKTFILFFKEYFRDCESIAFKIISEFYTKDDMIDIFKDYNKSCSSKVKSSVN